MRAHIYLLYILGMEMHEKSQNIIQSKGKHIGTNALVKHELSLA